MDLTKVTNEKKLHICKWYFRAGFALLPFVWAINTIWFYAEAFTKPPYEEQKQIKKYVILSGIGALIWISVLVTWMSIFQEKREEWGDFGDAISFVIPLAELN